MGGGSSMRLGKPSEQLQGMLPLLACVKSTHPVEHLSWLLAIRSESWMVKEAVSNPGWLADFSPLKQILTHFKATYIERHKHPTLLAGGDGRVVGVHLGNHNHHSAWASVGHRRPRHGTVWGSLNSCPRLKLAEGRAAAGPSGGSPAALPRPVATARLRSGQKVGTQQKILGHYLGRRWKGSKKEMLAVKCFFPKPQ